jgi:hypothetical protein
MRQPAAAAPSHPFCLRPPVPSSAIHLRAVSILCGSVRRTGCSIDKLWQHLQLSQLLRHFTFLLFNPGSSPAFFGRCARPCSSSFSTSTSCSSLLLPLCCSVPRTGTLFQNLTAHQTPDPVDHVAPPTRALQFKPSSSTYHSLLPSNSSQRFAKHKKKTHTPEKPQRLSRFPTSRKTLIRLPIPLRSSAHCIPQSHNTPVPPLQLVSGANLAPRPVATDKRPS